MVAKKAKVVQCLVVTSKVKALIKNEGMRSGKDFIDALSRKVNEMVMQACESTRQDRRMTLGAEDVAA
jgi:hypothetical protein